MKVIKLGKIPHKKEKTFICSCSNCLTIFEFSTKDCSDSTWDFKDQRYIYWVDCPLCKKVCVYYSSERTDF